jgi:hypothetical protein
VYLLVLVILWFWLVFLTECVQQDSVVVIAVVRVQGVVRVVLEFKTASILLYRVLNKLFRLMATIVDTKWLDTLQLVGTKIHNSANLCASGYPCRERERGEAETMPPKLTAQCETVVVFFLSFSVSVRNIEHEFPQEVCLLERGYLNHNCVRNCMVAVTITALFPVLLIDAQKRLMTK